MEVWMYCTPTVENWWLRDSDHICMAFLIPELRSCATSVRKRAYPQTRGNKAFNASGTFWCPVWWQGTSQKISIGRDNEYLHLLLRNWTICTGTSFGVNNCQPLYRRGNVCVKTKFSRLGARGKSGSQGSKMLQIGGNIDKSLPYNTKYKSGTGAVFSA